MNEQIASHWDKNKIESSGFDMTVIEAITMLRPRPPVCHHGPAVAMAAPAVRWPSGPAASAPLCFSSSSFLLLLLSLTQ